MRIYDLFHKPIDRDIKGVIKVEQNDEMNMKQELDEYVVTRELKKHIDHFFTSYGKGIDEVTDKIGVWISGFFGSGKSHFLKILSYLLENKKIDEKLPIEYFEEKVDDPYLLANMKRVSEFNSDIILFKIDSKADADLKTSKEALVKVFNKVFNDHLGYCGSIPWLAEIEQRMDLEGHYDVFKKRYNELNNESWESARNEIYYAEDDFVELYSSITGKNLEATHKWFSRAEDNYSLSIEKFSRSVREYLETKDENYRVVFLVDEMGQYIGDDTSLMLNLQTIVEDLGSVCGGRAWVVVTSQQDVDSVIKVIGRDFSKIQGRFNTRLNMSSANVDEVIKKRLLRKSEVNGTIDTLRMLYQDHESIIKNLLVFSTKTPNMKRHRSAEEYVEVYPFVPYQFYLLQEVFNSIRTHGASGKHLSEGERSLLSAFQESAVRFKEQDLHFLMPFYAFYHTIESFLDHDINIVVQRAIDNDALEDFDVNVLRLLFLIKYLGDKMPPSLENITTLMVDGIDVDKLELQKRVKKSLDRLFEQALIQKNGDAYIFLTNAEQDINSEIKNIDVDYSEVIKNLSAHIFDDILKARNRFTYTSDHIFTYNHKFDGDYYSSPRGELTLQVVSPAFNSGDDQDSLLKMLTTQDSSVILRLPDKMGYFSEMEEAIQIKTYLRRNEASSKIPEVDRIKATKGEEIQARKERVVDLLVTALSRADVFVYGQRVEIKAKDPNQRVDEALGLLVDNKYTKIKLLTPFIPSSGTKGKLLEIFRENPQDKISGTNSNQKAYDEILSHIENMDKMHVPLTVKSITNKYGKEPYHWRSEDLKGLLLRMFHIQAISLIFASEALDPHSPDKIVDLISKESTLESIKIKRKIKPSKDLIKDVKRIMEDAFHHSLMTSDESQLKVDVEKILKDELRQGVYDGQDRNIQHYLKQYKEGARYPYPGRVILEEGKEILESILKIKEEIQFFQATQEAEEDLLEYAKEVDDVKEFFIYKRAIFDQAVEQICFYEASETYVTDQKTIKTIQEMKNIVSMPSPYREIYRLPELRDRFVKAFGELLDEEIAAATDIVRDNEESTLKYLDSSMIPEEEKYSLRAEIDRKFDKMIVRLNDATVINDAIVKKEESFRLRKRFIEKIDNIVEELSPLTPPTQPPSVSDPVTPLKVKSIDLKSVSRHFKDIKTNADIEEAVYTFKQMLLNEKENYDVIKFN